MHLCQSHDLPFSKSERAERTSSTIKMFDAENDLFIIHR